MRRTSSANEPTWEQEELRRSAYVARASGLRPAECERYLHPTADSVFPLDYAFYLLGDLRGKVVLDLGCGSGENLPILARRGGNVIGLDLSPELIALAEERLRRDAIAATLKVASAYDTGLASGSVDVIFCMAVLHHLDLAKARRELLRILRPGGYLIVREPVRDSSLLRSLRKLMPERGEDISAFERPLTSSDITFFSGGLDRVEGARFRLPHVAVVQRVAPGLAKQAWSLDQWLLRRFPRVQRYASIEVVKFVKARAAVTPAE